MKEPSTSSSASAKNKDDSDEDEDINIITDGLLTSLTDTAISNLSQLAALQERCESQQQHSHQSQYQQQQPTTKQQQQQQTTCDTLSDEDDPLTMTVGGGVILEAEDTGGGGGGGSGGGTLHDELDDPSLIDEFIIPTQDPFLVAAAVTSQASATSALCGAGQSLVSSAIMQPTPTSTSSTSMMSQHHHQRHVSASSSISPPSTIHQADLASSAGSGQSLASTVAAAAITAAANLDHQHQQQQSQQHYHHQQQHHLAHQRLQQQQQHQQQQPQQQMVDPLEAATSRHRHLIGQSPTPTSALTPPEFYHSLHQAQNLHQHQQQQQQQQQHHQRPSSSASLHFSPSTSITPSPISPMMQQQSRRSMTSNATSSSSLMSPIASPNYLRRQFMTDRIPLMSPSPTSGIITGSSSGASSSLAHLLHQHHPHHHHQQQRSVSALGGGPILSPSPTAWSPLSGSTSSTAVSPLMNNKNSSQARLNNMQIRHKFGYLGSGRAQFNSPHGFCLGLNQEIVVADTNNHRVCIFDKSGTYITQFGSPGKEEGQLWNPRKVAILHRPIVSGSSSSGLDSSSGLLSSSLHQQQQQQQHHHHLQSSALSRHQHHQHHQISKSTYSSGQFSGSLNQYLNNNEPLYVVCDRGAERSRMQLFTKDGSFIKKIGIHYIDIVAGLAITQNGLIIVVDSVSPTVYIINGETGVLNGWFDCSGHMKEPSDIAVKSDSPGNEYFICDFKGHCVVVFSEQGEYLRRIGHDGLTSYPNGIDISDDGDILVGDSHGNRFHVVVFDRNGNFVSQFECPHVKVSRCCGLKITREGYIVTLAKNNHHVLVLDTIHI